MYSDNDCFDINFDFEKHLHLNDVPFEDAIDSLFIDYKAQQFSENLEGIDWSERMGTSDDEVRSQKEFIEHYSQLPLYSYGTVKAHKYIIESEIISKAFVSIKKVVDSFADRIISKLADQISVQDFRLPDTLMVFYEADDNAPKKKLPVDILGLYEWGRLKAYEEKHGYDHPANGYINISDGPQIILDSRKIFRLSKGQDAEFLMTVTAIHELMHSLLDPKNRDKKDKMPHNLLYRHIKEEAWANALTLMAIKSAGLNDLLEYAIGFMKTQPKECGYQYGIKLFNDNANNWEEWIEEKAEWRGNDPRKEKQFIEEVKNF